MRNHPSMLIVLLCRPQIFSFTSFTFYFFVIYSIFVTKILINLIDYKNSAINFLIKLFNVSPKLRPNQCHLKKKKWLRYAMLVNNNKKKKIFLKIREKEKWAAGPWKWHRRGTGIERSVLGDCWMSHQCHYIHCNVSWLNSTTALPCVLQNHFKSHKKSFTRLSNYSVTLI